MPPLRDDAHKLTSRTGSPTITTQCRRCLGRFLGIRVGVTTMSLYFYFYFYCFSISISVSFYFCSTIERGKTCPTNFSSPNRFQRHSQPLLALGHTMALSLLTPMLGDALTTKPRATKRDATAMISSDSVWNETQNLSLSTLRL